jgi:hypothetical protein
MSNILTLSCFAPGLSLPPAKSWYGLFAVAVLSLLPLKSQAQEVPLAAWDVSGTVNYGESPLAASSAASNTTTLPLTKGSLVNVPASGAAARAWGGTEWTSVDAASAISGEKFFTFGAAPGPGYRVSFTQIDRLDYRRSNTGPAEGLLQYQVGAGAFTDVGPLSFSSSASGGESLGPILLSSISELQNVAGETPVTFRIVPFGASSTGGTFYIYDRANTTAADLSVKGLVSPAGGIPPAITSFSPDNGGAGTVVTIDGTSFTAIPTVSFNGIPAPGATVNADRTRITVTVPAGATTGLIVVSTSGGAAASPSAFTVPPLPVLALSTDPTFFAENATLDATVSRPAEDPALSSPLTVNLSSSNSGKAVVPATVVIPANELFATFTISGVPDNVFTPAVTATITASSLGYASGTTDVSVTNVDPAPPAGAPIVVINKFLNITPDLVELLVVGNGTPGTTVDLRGMILKDFSSSMANDGGGKRVFSPTAPITTPGAPADSNLFEAVPVGTLIVVTNNAVTTDTDTSDFLIRVGLADKACFTGTTGTFDLSAAEMVMLKAAGSAEAGQEGAIHTLAAGPNAPASYVRFDSIISAKLFATGTNSAIAQNATSTISDFNGVGAISSGTLSVVDFGKANNPSNNGYIRSLRGITSLSGVGAASIENKTPGSPFIDKNIFGRGLSAQKASITVFSDVSPGTLTRLSIVVPSALGSPTAPNLTVTGAGAGTPVVSITGQTISITGTAATTVNPVVVTLSGLSTPSPSGPSADGRYPFIVSTAGPSGTLAPLATTPAAVVIIPVESLREVDPVTGIPEELNRIVAISGVVTEENFNNSQLSAFIQDGNSGINIFSFNLALATLTRGHRYVVTGTIVQFAGLTEISPAVASDLIDLGPDTAPLPLVVTATQLADPVFAESIEGRLIRMEGLSYVSGNWADPSNANTNDVVLADAVGSTLTIRIAQATDANSPPASYPATITGILSQAALPLNPFSGYVLMPRDAADVVANPVGYGVWAATYPEIGGPDDDADGDGQSNFLEYALGTIPNDPGSVQVPGVTLIQGEPGLMITKGTAAAADPMVKYRMEGSTDLTDWALTPDLEVAEDATTYSARYLGSSPRYYFRLKVGPPPILPALE